VGKEGGKLQHDGMEQGGQQPGAPRYRILESSRQHVQMSGEQGRKYHILLADRLDLLLPAGARHGSEGRHACLDLGCASRRPSKDTVRNGKLPRASPAPDVAQHRCSAAGEVTFSLSLWASVPHVPRRGRGQGASPYINPARPACRVHVDRGGIHYPIDRWS
jgi:hypothetical protein